MPAVLNNKVVALDMQYASHHYASAQTMRIESGHPCRVCGRGAGDAFICAQCAEEWEVHLGNVPSLLEDLTIAAQRRVRFGMRGGNPTAGNGPTDWTETRHLHTRHPSHTTLPMPVDLRASEWLSVLQGELVAQIRTMCDTFDLDVPALGSDTAAMSRWLLCQADNLRRMPDAHGMVQDLDVVMRGAILAIDSPLRSKYVCQCTCGLAIWARPGQAIVTCVCDRAYDVESTRAKRLLTAHDYLVSIREAHTLSGVSKSTIKSWISRGKLTVRGDRTDVIDIHNDGTTVQREVTVHVIRYGDVVTLLARSLSDTRQDA